MDTILPALPEGRFPVSIDNFIVICMGYAEISPEKKLKEILRHETEKDWTYRESIKSKLAHCRVYCDESRTVKKTAERLGLKYFDISFEREKIFDEIMLYIKNKN